MPDTRPQVNLFTSAGGIGPVRSLRIAAASPPDVVLWGSRTFMYDMTRDDAWCYREAIVVAATDEGVPFGDEVPTTPPPDTTPPPG